MDGAAWKHIGVHRLLQHNAHCVQKYTSPMAARCAALGMSRIEVSLDGEGHFLARELAVHTRERFELVLQAGGILRVQGAADKLAAIRGHAHTLSCNLRREDKVFKDGTVDSRQRTAAGPRLRRTALADQ